MKYEKTINVEFVKGATGTESLIFDELKHIVFAGRSNVGKSSTINAIVQKTIARSSSTPGKTREMNFFRCKYNDNKNDIYLEWYMVDLPGYGYAKVSKEERDLLLKRSLFYITAYTQYIQSVMIVIDSKVGITDYDKEFISYIPLEIPITIIANKSDKLNQKALSKLTKELKSSGFNVVIVSATSGKGIHNAKQTLIETLLNKKS